MEDVSDCCCIKVPCRVSAFYATLLLGRDYYLDNTAWYWYCVSRNSFEDNEGQTDKADIKHDLIVESDRDKKKYSKTVVSDNRAIIRTSINHFVLAYSLVDSESSMDRPCIDRTSSSRYPDCTAPNAAVYQTQGKKKKRERKAGSNRPHSPIRHICPTAEIPY